MKEVMDFISSNQTLIITCVLCLTWIANKVVNYMAAKPQEDFWDKIKPYSNAACKLVFDGVEFLAKNKKMSSAQKGIEYADTLAKFADYWKVDKAEAVAQLYAWYASNKKKTSEQITADSVAIE